MEGHVVVLRGLVPNIVNYLIHAVKNIVLIFPLFKRLVTLLIRAANPLVNKVDVFNWFDVNEVLPGAIRGTADCRIS